MLWEPAILPGGCWASHTPMPPSPCPPLHFLNNLLPQPLSRRMQMHLVRHSNWFPETQQLQKDGQNGSLSKWLLAA